MGTDQMLHGPAARWTNWDTAWMASITVVAGAIRLFRLGSPPVLVFDEQYYAKDACFHVQQVIEPCGLHGSIIEVHPPLGKWAIGVGIELFGWNPFGYRIAAVVAGTLAVAFTYLLCRVVLSSTLGASIGAAFVAVDFLHFVHSRLAMLEVFFGLFALIAILAAVYDRRVEASGHRDRWRWRWRALAGMAGGAAIATKWSGVIILLAVAGLCIAGDAGVGEGTGRLRRLAGAFRRSWLSWAISFVALPALVYAASYLGWQPGVPGPWVGAAWFETLWAHQRFMLDYFVYPRPPHPYDTPGWSWLLALNDFPYWLPALPRSVREISAIGNPLTWIPTIPVTLCAAWAWFRGRDRRTTVLLGGLIGTYGLWFAASLAGYRPMFVYYLVAAIPFLGGLFAWGVLQLVHRHRWGPHLLVAYAALVAISLLFVYPILADVEMAPPDWRARADLYRVCPVPPPPAGEKDEFAIQTTLRLVCEASGG